MKLLRQILLTVFILFSGYGVAFGQLSGRFVMLDFSGTNVTSGCAPFVAIFSDSSTYNGNPITYSNTSTGGAYNSHTWTFGVPSGVTSNLQSPTFVFVNPGTYTITLTVSPDGVQQTTVQKTITIYPQPVVGFTGTPLTGCNPLTVTLCDTTPGSTSRIWDNGSGRLDTNRCFTTTYHYDSIANINCFNVTLIATNQYGCSKTLTKNNYVCINLPPAAYFYADTPVVCDSPWIVTFHDSSRSSNPLVYSWQFGDGNISSLRNPVHTYTSVGNYTVKLTVTDTICNTTSTFQIANYVKLRKGSVDFTSLHDTICQGGTVSFTGILTGNIDNVFWFFGEPGSSSQNQNPSYTYNTAGTWSVTLTGTNTAGCVYDTTYQNLVVVNRNPTVSFTANNTTSCQAPFTVNFTSTVTGNPITNYNWHFQDPLTTAATTSGSANPTYTYDSSGDYTVRLTVIDANGCTATAVHNNYINIAPTIVAFSTDTTQGCIPLTVNFTDRSTSTDPIISWRWNFGDPASSASNTATGQTAFHTYNTVGTYNACLSIVTQSGCQGTKCIVIKAGTPPQAIFSVSNNNPCVNDPITITNQSTGGANTFSWDFGDASTSTQQNPNPHVYDTPGSFNIRLTSYNNGCADDTVISITVKDPKADFNYTTSCTSGGLVIFTDASINADHWTWNFGDNTPVSNMQSPTHTYATSGTFTVTLTVSNSQTGCTTIATKQINVSLLNANWTVARANGCAPFTAVFNSNATGNNVTYRWTFGDPSSGTSNTSVQRNPTHTYNNAGTYTVSLTATDINGCTQTITRVDTITVTNILVNFTVAPQGACITSTTNPTVTFTDLSVAQGNSPITGWLWDFGDGATSTLQNPTHTYTVPNVYDIKLSVTNAANCTFDKIKVGAVKINKPIAGFDAGFNLFCADQPIVFDNTSLGNGLTYQWNFGDPNSGASNTSTIRKPQHSFADTGMYTISLIVTDNLGCKDSLIVPGGVHIANPSLLFTADDTFRYCPPQVVNFTNLVNFDTINASSVYWNFGDGTSSNVFNPSHIYNVAGQFDVKLVVAFTNGCRDSVTYLKKITVGGAVGNITASVDSGCSPLHVCFNAHTNGSAVQHVWLFGDTYNSPGSDTICYTYRTPGVYSPAVILVDTQTPVCQYVLPYADSILVDTVFTNFGFSADTVCEVAPVQFFDSSTTLGHLPIVKWDWNFGDGTTDTVQNPTHYFVSFGTLNVTLRAYDAFGCFSEKTKSIFVHKRPTALFTVSDTVGCDTLTALFRDSSIAGDGAINSWYWNFGDPSTNADTSIVRYPPAYFYGDTGIYPASLIVKDAFGCIDTNIVNIGIYRHPDGITGQHTIALCKYDTIQLQGAPNYNNYDWSPGRWLSDSTIAQPLAFPLDTIIYTLVTTDVHGCATTDSITVNVNPLPFVFITPSPDTFICYGDTLTLNGSSNALAYQWTPNYNLSAPFDTVTRAWPLKSTTYQLYVVDSNGCKKTDTVHVLVNVFHTDYQVEQVCLGDSTQFVQQCFASDLPIVQYSWTFGDNNNPASNTSLNPNPVHLYTDSGKYTTQLVVTDPNGCTDTLIKKANVYYPPHAVAGTDTVICFGQSIQLTSSGGDSIFWSPNVAIDNNQVFNPIVSPQYTTTYIAHITNGVCPFDTAQVHVKVSPTPQVQTIGDETIVKGTTVELTTTADAGLTFSWTPADSTLSCTDCQSPVARPIDSTTYTVTVTDRYGCTNSKNVTIKIDYQCSPDQVFVGNGFTPNNDGVNDRAYARLYGLRNLKYFRIFDRWGNMVFETTDANTGWDGKNKNGEQLNSGVYVYVVEAECFNNEIVVKTGNVTLIK